MWYFVALVVVIGFALAAAAIGSAIGQGKAVASAMEGTARQPEAATKILINMMLGLAFIEALTIYCLIISFQLIGRLPATEEILKLIK